MPPRRPRLPTPTANPAPTLCAADRRRALRQQLSELGRTHRANGGSAEEWANVLKELSDLDHLPAFDSAPFRRIQLFGNLLERWYGDPDWLNEAGEPRALSLAGARGFVGLCGALGLSEPAARALWREGRAAGAFVRVARGRVVPRNRTALLRQTPDYLDAVAIVLGAWGATWRHNDSPQTPQDARRLERGIYYQRIPAALERRFHLFVRETGGRAVHDIDDWIVTHRAGPDEEDVVEVGFHALGFSHEIPEPAPPRRRRRGA